MLTFGSSEGFVQATSLLSGCSAHLTAVPLQRPRPKQNELRPRACEQTLVRGQHHEPAGENRHAAVAAAAGACGHSPSAEHGQQRGAPACPPRPHGWSTPARRPVAVARSDRDSNARPRAPRGSRARLRPSGTHPAPTAPQPHVGPAPPRARGPVPPHPAPSVPSWRRSGDGGGQAARRRGAAGVPGAARLGGGASSEARGALLQRRGRLREQDPRLWGAARWAAPRHAARPPRPRPRPSARHDPRPQSGRWRPPRRLRQRAAPGPSPRGRQGRGWRRGGAGPGRGSGRGPRGGVSGGGAGPRVGPAAARPRGWP